MDVVTDIFRLNGTRVLVTGAGSGLGAHFVQVLARAGAEVILAGRRLEPLQHVAGFVREAGGVASCVTLDVSQEQSVHEAFDTITLPDVVINNAGINVESSMLDLKQESWDRVMETNVKGAWLLARETIRRWKAQGRGGNVVNVASILGLRVQRQLGVYAASKAALVQLTRSLALDFARDGVRVNALCPGYFATEMNRDWLDSEAGVRMKSRIPMARVGELSELEGPLLLLASSASAYMTGALVAVDGGHLHSSL